MLYGNRPLRGLPLIAFNTDEGSGGGTGDPATDHTTTDDAGDKPLGPGGEKALQAWKERAKKAEADAKRAAELQAELDAIKAAQMTDQEKAIADARKEAEAAARAEVLGSVNSRLFTAELKAAMATALRPEAQKDLLVKPEVALALLGLDEYPVTETGDIDSEAISQAVTAYAAARPHLAASATQSPGSADLGARTTPPPKDIATQIAEAEAAGDWTTAGALKLQQLAALPRP